MPTLAPPQTERRPRISPLLFIFLTVFIDLMGVGVLQPVLPYLVDRFRSDAATLGWLSTSFALAQFLAAPVLGSLSDRYGRRPVLLLCMLGTAIGYFVFGVADSLWLLFAARILAGVTGGVISTAQAYIADISKPEERTKNFGLIGTALGLGFIFGPTLGGYLAQFQLNLPVFVAGALALGNTVLGYTSLRESLPPEVRRQNRERHLALSDFNPLARVAAVLRDPRIRNAVYVFLLFNLSFAGFTSIFPKYLLERYQWQPEQAAPLFLCIGVTLALVQGVLIRRLVPRYGERTLILAGFVATVAAFVLIVVAPTATWLYGTQVLLAIGVGIGLPSLRGLISNQVSGGEQGRVIGGSAGLTSLAQILGPMWAAYVFDHVGFTAPFVGMVALTLLSLGFLLRQRTPVPQAAS